MNSVPPRGPTDVSFQCCFTCTETIRLIRDGTPISDGHLDFHTALPELCLVGLLLLLWCFASTKTIRLIRDGESRAATSAFTQLLSSDRLTWLGYLPKSVNGATQLQHDRALTWSHTPSIAFLHFPLKLCQNWLRYWKGTLYLRAAVHRRGQRLPTVEAT